jgi:hypothetical protein
MLLSLAAAVPALVLGVILSEWMAAVPVMMAVVVTSGTLLGGWAGARENARQRAEFAGAIATLAYGPLFALLTLMMLGDALVTAHLRCGTWMAGMVVLAPIVTTISMGFLLPVALVGSAGSVRADRVIRRVAQVALLFATVAVLSIAPGARRPSSSVHLASLARIELRTDVETSLSPDLGSVTLEPDRDSNGKHCRLRFGARKEEVLDLGHVREMRPSAEQCPRVRVALGPAWMLLESPDEQQQWNAVAALFRDPQWHIADLTRRDLRNQVSLPPGLMLNAACGWLLAMIATLLAARARKRGESDRDVALCGFAIASSVMGQIPILVGWAARFI